MIVVKRFPNNAKHFHAHCSSIDIVRATLNNDVYLFLTAIIDLQTQEGSSKCAKC